VIERALADLPAAQATVLTMRDLGRIPRRRGL
jgi:DNA-directed RNA polymerase specialized sigma24 family protein